MDTVTDNTSGMKQTFTAGPWHCDLDPETGENRVIERAGVIATVHETRSWERVSHIVRTRRTSEGGGFMVAECPANAPNSFADANLIAAAPDMHAALSAVNKLIAEAAMTGFNWKDGDWAERLFASQQATSAALRRAEGR
jgi:hypothetical protein